MKDTKDFQERYNRWKNGERYWDIRGVELPKYDTGKYVTFEKDDGSVYNVNPNVASSSEITVTTPEVEIVGKKPNFYGGSAFRPNEAIHLFDKLIGNTVGRVMQPITKIPGAMPVLRTLTPSNWVGTIRTGVAPWSENNPGFGTSENDQALNSLFNYGVSPAMSKLPIYNVSFYKTPLLNLQFLRAVNNFNKQFADKTYILDNLRRSIGELPDTQISSIYKNAYKNLDHETGQVIRDWHFIKNSGRYGINNYEKPVVFYQGTPFGGHSVVDSKLSNATIGGASAIGEKGNFTTTDLNAAYNYADGDIFNYNPITQSPYDKLLNLKKLRDYGDLRPYEHEAQPMIYPFYIRTTNPMNFDFEGNAWSKYPHPEQLGRIWKLRTQHIKRLPNGQYHTVPNTETFINFRDVINRVSQLKKQGYSSGRKVKDAYDATPTNLRTIPMRKYDAATNRYTDLLDDIKGIVELSSRRIKPTTNGVVEQAFNHNADGLFINNVVDAAQKDNYAINEFVFRNSNQAKLANPFVLNDNGDLISILKRDDFTNPDIRYNYGKEGYPVKINLPKYGGGKIGGFVHRMGPLIYQGLVSRGVKNINAAYANLMRQISHESGYGTSGISRQHNYGGIKIPGSNSYRKFKSDRDFVDYYLNLMTSRYRNAIDAKDLNGFVNELGSKGYFRGQTAAQYLGKLNTLKSLDRAVAQDLANRRDFYNQTTGIQQNPETNEPEFVQPIPKKQQSIEVPYLDPQKLGTITFPVNQPIIDIRTILPKLKPMVYQYWKSDESFDHGKSGIHINPANRGKFNATKKRTGKTTKELTHSKNPLTRKRAIFALNASKWNKK